MDNDWPCTEMGFNDFLAANPPLDADGNLQWVLYRTYWESSASGHRNALNACMSMARERGVKASLYTDPKTKRILQERGM